jgi:hypothetical protein
LTVVAGNKITIQPDTTFTSETTTKAGVITEKVSVDKPVLINLPGPIDGKLRSISESNGKFSVDATYVGLKQPISNVIEGKINAAAKEAFAGNQSPLGIVAGAYNNVRSRLEAAKLIPKDGNLRVNIQISYSVPKEKKK